MMPKIKKSQRSAFSITPSVNLATEGKSATVGIAIADGRAANDYSKWKLFGLKSKRV